MDDGVNEPDEKGKISIQGCGKTNLCTKVAKLAKSQGRKWHFAQNNIIKLKKIIKIIKTTLIIQIFFYIEEL
ncbi:hypothetical protein Hanom_Chr01g00069901 [Helianthus anomalus]